MGLWGFEFLGFETSGTTASRLYDSREMHAGSGISNLENFEPQTLNPKPEPETLWNLENLSEGASFRVQVAFKMQFPGMFQELFSDTRHVSRCYILLATLNPKLKTLDPQS